VRRLMALRDARLYLAGQALSGLGDLSLSLAMGVWVKQLTGSSGAAGSRSWPSCSPSSPRRSRGWS
jgi:hypothetical protein